MNNDNDIERKPSIITLASGKGGVGKSFLAANMAIHLASLGKRTILIDLDFGGANLHSFLGLSPLQDQYTLFSYEKIKDFDQLFTESGLENLSLLSLAARRANIANLSYIEKTKVIKGIRSLDADYLIIDTESGSSYDPIDFYLLSPHGILITTAEPLSIENLYQFITAAILRKIKLSIQIPDIKKGIKKWMKLSVSAESNFIETFISSMNHFSKGMLEKEIKIALENFKPKLIINRARTPEDRELGFSIQRMVAHYFGITIDYLGYVEDQQLVGESILKKKPLMIAYQESIAAKCIENITNLYVANYVE